jgi:hypothetical protein
MRLARCSAQDPKVIINITPPKTYKCLKKLQQAAETKIHWEPNRKQGEQKLKSGGYAVVNGAFLNRRHPVVLYFSK